jgi:hypothetical protein
MDHKGQQSSSRKLVWVERLSIAGWGCSECAWIFAPINPPTGDSLDERIQKLQTRLFEEFAAHICAEHPRYKAL